MRLPNVYPVDLKSSYKLLRRLGNGPSDKTNKELKIPKFEDENMTDKECAEFLASYFAKISQSLKPVNLEDCHPKLRKSILDGRESPEKVILEEYQVHAKL